MGYACWRIRLLQAMLKVPSGSQKESPTPSHHHGRPLMHTAAQPWDMIGGAAVFATASWGGVDDRAEKKGPGGVGTGSI